MCRSMEHSGWGEPIHYLHRRAMVDELDPCQNSLGMVTKHGDMNDQNVLVHQDKLSG
jgi:Ser/Thr protein kinase RdoA (MazF antagonist)